MTPDRFLHIRGRELPQDYVEGMNCIFDAIGNERLRQMVYQKLRGEPDSFSLLPQSPDLFGVQAQPFLAAYRKSLAEVYSLAAVDPEYGTLEMQIEESERGFGERLTLKKISLASAAINLLSTNGFDAYVAKIRQVNEIKEVLHGLKVSPGLRFDKDGKFLGFDRK